MPTAQGTLRFASCSALRHSTWRRALDKPLPRRVLAAARQRLLRHFNSPSFCRQADPRAMATQCSGQPLDEGDEHGPVRPIQACSWLGSAEHGGLLPQHDELDVLAGGRAAHQEDQSEQLTEDQVQPAQRDARIMSDHDHRWSATQFRVLAPHSQVARRAGGAEGAAVDGVTWRLQP